jgi:hypothetical protein
MCSLLRQPSVTAPLLQMDDLNADDPAANLGMHWHDREQCTFSREEGEVYDTYVAVPCPGKKGMTCLSGRATGPIDQGVCAGQIADGFSVRRQAQERVVSLLVLHGKASFRVDGAMGGQLRHRGQHQHHVHQRDRDPDEVGRQDPGAQDQQPGLFQRRHPQEQYGGGGGNGAIAAPG